MKLTKLFVAAAVLLAAAGAAFADDLFAKGIKAEKAGKNLEALTCFLKVLTEDKNNADAEKHMYSSLYAVGDGKYGINTNLSNSGERLQALMQLKSAWDETLSTATKFVASNRPVFELRYFDNIIPQELTEFDYNNNTMTFKVNAPYFKQYCPQENDEIMQILDFEFRKIEEAKNWGDKINGFPKTYIDELEDNNWLKKGGEKYSFDVCLQDGNNNTLATKRINYTVSLSVLCHLETGGTFESSGIGSSTYSGFSITSDNEGDWGETYQLGSNGPIYGSEGEIEEIYFSHVPISGINTSKLKIIVQNAEDSLMPIYISKSPNDLVPIHSKNKGSGNTVKICGRLDARGGAIRYWSDAIGEVKNYANIDFSNAYGIREFTTGWLGDYHFRLPGIQNIIFPSGATSIDFAVPFNSATLPVSTREVFDKYRDGRKVSIHFCGSKQLWKHIFVADSLNDGSLSVDFLYGADERKKEMLAARERDKTLEEARLAAAKKAEEARLAAEKAEEERIAAEKAWAELLLYSSSEIVSKIDHGAKTIKLKGTYSASDLEYIDKALDRRYRNKPDITLDLSEVEGMKNLGWLGTSPCASIYLPKDIESINANCEFEKIVPHPESSSVFKKDEVLYTNSGTVVDRVDRNIKNAKIIDGVIKIKSYAFYYCKSLTSVTIPDSVTTIGDNAFEGCTSLRSVTIPSSVTTIDSRAFYGCTSLTSITIPKSVKTIDRRAFEDCTSLKTVYYAGSKNDWKKIKIYNENKGNKPLLKAKIIYGKK
mgnify:CR=1 FL=1